MQIPLERYQTVLESVPLLCVDGVVQGPDGRFLLVKRRLEPMKDAYWTPGGRVLKGETVNQAIIRKMNEELGLGCELVKFLGFYEDEWDRCSIPIEGLYHTFSMVFLLKAPTQDVHLDDQSSDWGWFDQLPNRLVQKTQWIEKNGIIA